MSRTVPHPSLVERVGATVLASASAGSGFALLFSDPDGMPTLGIVAALAVPCAGALVSSYLNPPAWFLLSAIAASGTLVATAMILAARAEPIGLVLPAVVLLPGLAARAGSALRSR